MEDFIHKYPTSLALDPSTYVARRIRPVVYASLLFRLLHLKRTVLEQQDMNYKFFNTASKLRLPGTRAELSQEKRRQPAP